VKNVFLQFARLEATLYQDILTFHNLSATRVGRLLIFSSVTAGSIEKLTLFHWDEKNVDGCRVLAPRAT
jgi:hypothetical protein